MSGAAHHCDSSSDCENPTCWSNVRYAKDDGISSDRARGGTSIVKEFFKHPLPRGVHIALPPSPPRLLDEQGESRARVGMCAESASPPVHISDETKPVFPHLPPSPFAQHTLVT